MGFSSARLISEKGAPAFGGIMKGRRILTKSKVQDPMTGFTGIMLHTRDH